jgi:hypothetical protein
MIIFLALTVLDLFSLSIFTPTAGQYFWRRWNSIWFPWLRVALDGIFVALWAGATGSAFYTCSDLCNAAGNSVADITYASLQCICSTGSFGSRRSLSSRDYTEQKTGRYQAAQAFDVLLL